jgi:hypothetical protein
MLILPPGGGKSFFIKVTNTGDMTDEAIFDFSGLEGTATRTLSYRGMPIDGPIVVPKGWGAFNESTGTFFFDGNNPLIGSTNDSSFEKIVANGLVDSHVSRPYYAIVLMEIEVSPGAENGAGGLLEVVVTSVSNAANRSGKITFSLSVETVQDIELLLDGDVEKDLTFGEIGNPTIFEIELFNSGNIESEIKVFTSGGVRGWNLILGFKGPGDCEYEAKGDHLICTIDEGESVIVTVRVNPPGGENNDVTDSFKFTLSAEPTDIGLVGRENLELTVNGEPAEFGLNSLITPNVLFGIATLVLLGFAALALRRRN